VPLVPQEVQLPPVHSLPYVQSVTVSEQLVQEDPVQTSVIQSEYPRHE
jgi:hypothetical protein